MVRHPRGSCIVYPLLFLEMTTPQNKLAQSMLSSICRKFASQALLIRMQLTLHATRPTPVGASRLVQAMSAWSAKTRRAPFRHCRDVRGYGNTTTAMHDMSTLPAVSLIAKARVSDSFARDSENSVHVTSAQVNPRVRCCVLSKLSTLHVLKLVDSGVVDPATNVPTQSRAGVTHGRRQDALTAPTFLPLPRVFPYSCSISCHL